MFELDHLFTYPIVLLHSMRKLKPTPSNNSFKENYIQSH